MLSCPADAAAPRSPRRSAGALALALWIATSLAAPGAKAQPASASPPSEIERSVLVEALRAELARTSELSMEDTEAPHYVAYGVLDVDQIEVIAEFGGIVQDKRERQRYLRVDLRVGTPAFDSSNTSRQGFFVAQLPIDDDLVALRRQIWWTTDRAFKGAVEALGTKRAEAAGESGSDTEVPDFVPAPPLQLVGPAVEPLPEREALRGLAARLSGVLREAEHIDEGGVRIRAVRVERYLVSDEGSLGYEPALFVQWAVVGRSIAPDGMNLLHHDALVVRSFADLPDEKELTARVRQMSRELAALREAPVGGAYVGPVLFEGPASGAVLRRLLVPHITGTPAPSRDGIDSAEPAGPSRDQSSAFARRVGKRVAPRWLSLVDDPRPEATRAPLPPGSYLFDDEGVRAQRTPLIDEGRFVGFLMSRTPARDFLESNGHGRGALLSPRAQAGSLIVRSQASLSRKQLYARALREARAQGEAYALVIRQIDDPAITAAYRGADAQGSGGEALYAVQLGTDGSEKPVRGLGLIGANPRSLRDLLATGDRAHAYDYFQPTYDSGGEGYWEAFPIYAVGASIRSPDLLFEEMEVAPVPSLRAAPPRVERPYAR